MGGVERFPSGAWGGEGLDDTPSTFSASYGPQHPAQAEGNREILEPVSAYPDDQFVITECPGGYEGRSLPLPGSDAGRRNFGVLIPAPVTSALIEVEIGEQ